MGLFKKQPKQTDPQVADFLNTTAQIERGLERAASGEQEVFAVGDRARAFGSEGNIVEIDETGPSPIYVLFAEDIQQPLRCEAHQLERV